MQTTPSANRLHIGVFGKTNSGKSSFINRFTGQNVSIVSDRKGTTTDPVYKPMELLPLGPVTFIDTAGFSDGSPLEGVRMEKTRLAAEKTDIAVFVVSTEDALCDCDSLHGLWDEELFSYFQKKNIPVLFLVNKSELNPACANALCAKIEEALDVTALPISTTAGSGFSSVKEALIRIAPESFFATSITGSLLVEDDLVLLVMPQDIQAPKGRLILPQVQTLRELLDKKCMVMCTTTDKLQAALVKLSVPPKLIITDSQAFSYVHAHKPAESLLTSFSVLFAACKGDISYYVESARKIDALTENSHILIAECCTHAPLSEDIGRVKIPRLLRKKTGPSLTVDFVSGTDFPDKLTSYDLIIQCGGCMFNRTYVLSCIARAKAQNVPMTNYGIAIAYLNHILEDVVFP